MNLESLAIPKHALLAALQERIARREQAIVDRETPNERADP